jgi:hypothetical protein
LLPSAIEARLIGQNFNVTIGKQFRFVVSIPNKATLSELRTTRNAVLRVEVHTAVATREAVREAASGITTPSVIETHDLPFADLGTNETGDVIALLSSNAGGSSVRLRKSGVYPVSLSIRVGEREASRLLTFVNFITVQTSRNSLSVSLVAEVNPPLSQTPAGETSLAEVARTTLNNVVSSLNGNSGVMSLRMSPETLALRFPQTHRMRNYSDNFRRCLLSIKFSHLLLFLLIRQAPKKQSLVSNLISSSHGGSKF